ncbi:3-keto-disaccharide hydrolase [Eudoraea chungangensis]|uniref:3-keto-disaccharide hydrolase n=1 Tax=Eudoraea chungangensis TaxID=1481905 RepID=UPI0023ED3E4B|nr:DUF1080 domain-containing protein [Eudoraea chungangensis]
MHRSINVLIKGFMIVGLLISTSACKSITEEKETSAIANSEITVGKFEPIFNGESLEDWEGDMSYWNIHNNVLIGEVTNDNPLKNNTFLIYKKLELQDFELKLEFMIEKAGNSGVNYRSEIVDSIPYALRGYQADIDGKNKYTGQNYEERKRTTLAYRGEQVIIDSQTSEDGTPILRENIKNNAWQNRTVSSTLGNSDSLRSRINIEDWNTCRIEVKGNKFKHYINGILMSEVEDLDSINYSGKGWLGLQLHVGPPMKVHFKNIFLKRL